MSDIKIKIKKHLSTDSCSLVIHYKQDTLDMHCRTLNMAIYGHSLYTIILLQIPADFHKCVVVARLG